MSIAWHSLDTWIVVTAALSAMACALPGNYLVLRRQSMMGDALSHTVLPGIVIAFLLAHRLFTAGWISDETYHATRHASMYVGAMVLGVLSAVLTEWVQKLGRVESSAALGVVFTSLFALGLLLVRAAADSVHIDPDCVLYGTIETVVMETWPETEIPVAAVVNGTALAINGLLLLLFYKELKISAFDPALATAQGIHAGWMHYALMAVTAATLVAAFESVGSILVIAMLIIPAATAHLLTDRLSRMILLSLMVAAASAALGHLLAIAVPPLVLAPLGFESLRDASASTAGMMAVAAGMIFIAAMLLGPRYGLLSKAVHRVALSVRIACEDVLGLLYRLEEGARVQPAGAESPGAVRSGFIRETLGIGALVGPLALWRLRKRGDIFAGDGRYRLTGSGRDRAKELVRAHRLWESYMAKHFDVPDDHLHETAERVEHYIGPALREGLEAELDRPGRDPHGREIPAGE